MFPLVLAHLVFWIVLLIGVSTDLGLRRSAVFVSLWVIGYVGSGLFSSSGLVFVSYVAVLDIVLVLVVFKGDVALR
jgi:hypothetical protein